MGELAFLADVARVRDEYPFAPHFGIEARQGIRHDDLFAGLAQKDNVDDLLLDLSAPHFRAGLDHGVKILRTHDHGA